MKSGKSKIFELEATAAEILSLKDEIRLRRPILIEFCGSPKSGKTTTINSLNIFFKRNGFKTKILAERAGVCPVPQKTHPYFNIWTLCAAVTEIIRYLQEESKDIDIIIADRGIFDALCWFVWLNEHDSYENPYLDDENFETLKNFATMDLWRSKIDIIYVFQVLPNISMEREHANLLTNKKGSIMNEYILGSYNKTISKVIEKYGDKFRKISRIDTTSSEPNEVSFEVTQTILSALREMLIEKIGYFRGELREKLKDGANPIEVIQHEILEFDNRGDVEEGFFIQPIPIAVITNRDCTKVLVVKKKKSSTSKLSAEREKLLIYLGGHV